jgi:hypothetical protein
MENVFLGSDAIARRELTEYECAAGTGRSSGTSMYRKAAFLRCEPGQLGRGYEVNGAESSPEWPLLRCMVRRGSTTTRSSK